MARYSFLLAAAGSLALMSCSMVKKTDTAESEPAPPSRGCPLPAAVCGLVQRSDGAPGRVLGDADLPPMALRATDLPEGFTAAGEQWLASDALLTIPADAGEQRARLEGWGRVMGYRTTVSGATLQRPATPAKVQHDIDRYNDARGAHQRLLEFDPARDIGLEVSAVRELDLPKPLGDEGRAFRMWVNDEGKDRILSAVVFRQGLITSMLSTISDFNRDDHGDHAYRLSRLVQERVATALQ